MYVKLGLMVTWLASYPRSGNTFYRVLLHRLFGFETNSMYSIAGDAERMTDDVLRLMQWIGQPETDREISDLCRDTSKHFLKTHDLPTDKSPAVVLVRDGRDAVVSFAHFIRKTEQGIENAPRSLFESTLEEIIRGDRFGGWSRNVRAWVDRGAKTSVVRYEDLIADPIETAVGSLGRLGIRPMFKETRIPTFAELH